MRWHAIQELHFDNTRRYQVQSDGDGNYRVYDTQTSRSIEEDIASDYIRMKANDFNRQENTQ